MVVVTTTRCIGAGVACGASAAMAGTRPSNPPNASMNARVSVLMCGVLSGYDDTAKEETVPGLQLFGPPRQRIDQGKA